MSDKSKSKYTVSLGTIYKFGVYNIIVTLLIVDFIHRQEWLFK